jgi:hypothetical protein
VIAALASAALWLGLGLAVLQCIWAVRTVDRDAIARVAIVQAALATIPVATQAIAGSVWLLVLAVAIAANARSRHYAAHPRWYVPLLTLGALLGSVAALFSLSSDPTRGWVAGAEHDLLHAGMAALAVAALRWASISERASRRAAATRAWVLAGWLFSTAALVLADMDFAQVRTWLLIASWLVAFSALHALARVSGSGGFAIPVGAALAQVGTAVAVGGMAASAWLTTISDLAVREGQRDTIGPWTVQLIGVVPVIADGVSALEADVEASKGQGAIVLRPRLPDERSGWSATTRSWAGRLSVSIGRERSPGVWPLRLVWVPFIGVSWAGWLMAIAGGLMIAGGRGLRIWQRRPDRGWRREAYR